MKLSRLIGIGLASLSLLPSLTACASKLPRVALTPIPEEFVEDCPETPVELATNGDLAVKIQTLRGDLRYCNADKRAMRAYNSLIKDKNPK